MSFQDMRKDFQKALKLSTCLCALNSLENWEISGVIRWTARKLTFLQVQAGRSLEENYAHTALRLGDTSRRRREAKWHLLVSWNVLCNWKLFSLQGMETQQLLHPSIQLGNWRFPGHVGEDTIDVSKQVDISPSLRFILERETQKRLTYDILGDYPESWNLEIPSGVLRGLNSFSVFWCLGSF